jgi:hypothetical protein
MNARECGRRMKRNECNNVSSDVASIYHNKNESMSINISKKYQNERNVE